MLFVPILLFLLGLTLLIKGGDWFVNSATGIAHRFKMSELLIGATVVSIGTTLPEVMTSAIAAASGDSGTAYGNAIGSIICNAALIAALTIAIRPSNSDRKMLTVPVLFFFGTAAIYLAFAYFFGEFRRGTGILLLAIFVVYTVVSIVIAKRTPDPIPSTPEIEESAPLPSDDEHAPAHPLWFEILFLVIGASAIAVGATLLVNNGQVIALELGVPTTIISLVFVSLGTSLPELVTAITALAKGHSALSLGNIIGANLFNLTLVAGTAATLAPFSLPTETYVGTLPSSLVIDLPVMVTVMLLLTLPTIIRNKTSRIQGIALLTIYAAFTVYTIGFSR